MGIFSFTRQYQVQIYYKKHMQVFANDVFQSFVRQVSKKNPKKYFNSNKVLQSSVGMIFKLHTNTQFQSSADIPKTSFDKIQLLFTQRSGYQGDRNAYNIVLPGGQCDDNQNDFQACKRELFEEIGLKVDQQCHYIGQLPDNFYYLQKRKRSLYMTCHIWLLKQECMNWKAKLSKDQLQNMLEPKNYLIDRSLRMGILERMASRYKMKILMDIGKKIESISTPELNLQMGRNLWGMTLWIWSYVLQMACKALTKQQNLDHQRLKKLEKCIEQMKVLQINFKQNFILKYPSLIVIKSWHYFNRVRPFTYSKISTKLLYLYGLLAICGVLYLMIY